MYACMYVCLSIYLSLSISLSLYIYIYVCMCIYIYIYIYIHLRQLADAVAQAGGLVLTASEIRGKIAWLEKTDILRQITLAEIRVRSAE